MGDTLSGLDESVLAELRKKAKEWGRRNNKNQSDLAAECGIADADLAHFLSGSRGLPHYAQANLASALGMDPARLLLLWERSQCAVQLQKMDKKEGAKATEKLRGWEKATEAFASMLAKLPDGDQLHEARGALGTLEDWPEAFLPLVVFVGDRRENPPSSPADLLAVSASLGDLFYFPRLHLPVETEIRSDKTCVVASTENLRALLKDKNLLVIGSPAANLVAREVNSGACFSFPVKPTLMDQAEALKKELATVRYYPDELVKFTGVNTANKKQEEWSRLRRHLIYGFARSGIHDPVDYAGPRAITVPKHADYGVVTLCRHPWSDTRIAIMAAGLHGPATAAAVKLLAQPRAFKGHPLGGVFRVHVPTEAPWEERFHHLTPDWDTHEYTVSGYADAVDLFCEQNRKDLDGEFRFWNPDDVRSLLKLVRPEQFNDTDRP